MQKTAKNFVELLRQGARMWGGMFNFGHMSQFSASNRRSYTEGSLVQYLCPRVYV